MRKKWGREEEEEEGAISNEKLVRGYALLCADRKRRNAYILTPEHSARRGRQFA